jgi:hypothetical protein
MNSFNWKNLSRSEQRVLIKLLGGGSTRTNSSGEIAELKRRGYVCNAGLTSYGMQLVTSAFRAQRFHESIRKTEGRGRM